MEYDPMQPRLELGCAAFGGGAGEDFGAPFGGGQGLGMGGFGKASVAGGGWGHDPLAGTGRSAKRQRLDSM